MHAVDPVRSGARYSAQLRAGVRQVLPAAARGGSEPGTEQAGEQSPISVASCKDLIHQARNNSLSQALPYERQKFVDLFGTNDQKEGVTAFLEKRKPNWTNS